MAPSIGSFFFEKTASVHSCKTEWPFCWIHLKNQPVDVILLTKHTVEFSEILHHLVCIKPYK